jgi:hypothetical protein
MLIDPADMAALPADGFIVRAAPFPGPASWLIAANGSAPRGHIYACYAALERALGFRFLHPLNATLPAAAAVVVTPVSAAQANATESPAWPIRGIHYHTEHPLELTELLQGLDSLGPDGRVAESWASMLPKLTDLLEWMVAQRLTRIEWVLLCAYEFSADCYSALRSGRLRTITATMQQWGIEAGADVAIAERQQHAMFMVNTTTADSPSAIADIHAHVDWLVAECGFNFISTENGYSEFTHGSDTTMLSWINETARYARDRYNATALIKCHCSTGQVCEHYVDPTTGAPLNFNFLPIVSDPAMGVMPHTVQEYAFDDPAPTYGNSNFTYMFDFLFEAVAQLPRRQVVYHPETAYWVNYDIDVPLFLPYYAWARVRDLRLIAAEERRRGLRMDGQVVFDSGWEWGYWLNAVVAARAAWDPCLDACGPAGSDAADEAAVRRILDYIANGLFGSDLLGGNDGGAAWINAMVAWMKSERALLVRGETTPGGPPPADITRRNGHAYLEGWDTFADLGALSKHALATQPVRQGLQQVRLPAGKDHPDYKRELAPLLGAMNDTFAALSQQLAAASAGALTGEDLLDELGDAAAITAARARQVADLYEYAATWASGNSDERHAVLADAEGALEAAAAIVQRREAAYRVPVQRIAGWRPNPTSYSYTYLWTVHSLFYFWRDYALATERRLPDVLSPCYLNIINPAEVAFGEGGSAALANLTVILRDAAEALHLAFLGDCASPPPSEPQYPRDL